jgi:hypothetical protein
MPEKVDCIAGHGRVRRCLGRAFIQGSQTAAIAGTGVAKQTNSGTTKEGRLELDGLFLRCVRFRFLRFSDAPAAA